MLSGRLLVFHKQTEKFFYQIGGPWQLDNPLGSSGAVAHLRQAGHNGATARQMVKDQDIAIVDKFVCRPYLDGLLEEAGVKMLNTWVAPTLQPAPGEWQRVARVLAFLTDNDAAAHEWLLDWAARKIQHPAAPSGVATVFNGQPGSGKGTFYQIMSHILGPHNTASIGRVNLESRFNARWVTKLYVLVDEARSEDGHSLMVSEALKAKITEQRIELEAKGANSVSIENHLTLQFNVNPGPSAVVVEEHDRRYTVLENTAMVPEDYANMLRSCFLPDGTPTHSFMAEIAGFYHDMKARTVDVGRATTPHTNASRAGLIHAGRPMHQLFFAEVADRGIDDFIDTFSHPQAAWDFQDKGVALDAVYQAYRDFCKHSGGQALRKNRFQLAAKEVWLLWKPTVGTKQQWALKTPRSASPESAAGPTDATQHQALA